jgi:GGDEF domain-containing protein
MAAAVTPLADLPRRTDFAQALEREVAAAREGVRTAVVFCDLGPAAGEVGHGGPLLAVVVARLRAALRRSDLLAHCGDGRFLALVASLPADSADEIVARIAAFVRATFDEPIAVGGRLYALTPVVGSLVHPGDGAVALTLLDAVDRALAAAVHPRD